MEEIRVRVPKELRTWLEEESRRKGLTVTALVVTTLWDRKERSSSGVFEEKMRRNSGVSAARAKFEPPTSPEAGAEMVAKGYHFSLTEFMAHYERQGWKLGNGRPMANWKATMVTWEEHWKEKQGANGGGATVGRQEYDTQGNRELVEKIKAQGW